MILSGCYSQVNSTKGFSMSKVVFPNKSLFLNFSPLYITITKKPINPICLLNSSLFFKEVFCEDKL